MTIPSFSERGVLPGEPDRDSGSVGRRGIGATLRGRWLAVAIPTVLALGLGVAFLTVATRSFTGVASLLIDARAKPAAGDPKMPAADAPDGQQVENQLRLITSDAVLRRAVDAERLADDPDFTRTGAGLGARVLQLLGMHSRPLSANDRTTQAVVALASKVTVTRSDGTTIADVAVTSTDPIKAARLADAVARAYLADQQAARNAAAERDSDWVRQQIADLQSALRAAELKVETFKRQHGIADVGGKPLDEQTTADASASLALAQSRAAELRARLDELQAVGDVGRNVDALPETVKSPVIDKLRTQYAEASRQQATLRQTLGNRHPALIEVGQQLRDLRRSITDELARVQTGLANDYQGALASVTSLQKQVAALKDLAGTSNVNRLRLDELQRDVDTRRLVYDRFVQSRSSARETAVDAPVGRIIAPARVPTSPSSPNMLAVLAASLCAGLGLGVAAALGAERLAAGGEAAPLDMVAATQPAPPPDVDRAAGGDDAATFAVPVLGYVPSPFGNATTLSERSWLVDRLRTAWPLTIEMEHVPTLPAFRTSVAALGLVEAGEARDKAQPRTILVTSDASRDSRTTFALGLAEAAAGQGRHAIVIDADESGSMLREIVTDDAKPALIDLMGTTRLCYRIAAPFRGSLSIVPIMPGESGIARRLGSRGTAVRIDGIGTNFDTVIFDGPATSQRDRLRALAATVDIVVLVAGKAATRDGIDQAVAAIDLPNGTDVVGVLAADFVQGGAADAAA